MTTSTENKVKSSSIRFPIELLDELTVAAKKNLRSTNSEIVLRLKRSLVAGRDKN